MGLWKPAASTKTGSTTRLDEHKARQLPLAGLGRFVRLLRCLRDLPFISTAISRDHPSGEIARKVSNWAKSLETT